jgi:uncharacterized RDD family membrane protein YckC
MVGTAAERILSPPEQGWTLRGAGIVTEPGAKTPSQTGCRFEATGERGHAGTGVSQPTTPVRGTSCERRTYAEDRELDPRKTHPTAAVGWTAAGGILPSMAVEADSVYFAAKDYAHPVRRLGALIIDLAFLIALLNAIYIPIAYAIVPASIRNQHRTPERQQEIDKLVKPIQMPVPMAWLALCIIYHIPFRRTRGGTLGYRLMGIRLVDRKGQTPPMRPLIKRFLIAIPSTMFIGLSYFSLFTSPKRQTMHDKWSGTWAIRKRAEPAGPAITAYNTSFLGTIPTTYIDVEPLPGVATSQAGPETAESPPAPADEPVMESANR